MSKGTIAPAGILLCNACILLHIVGHPANQLQIKRLVVVVYFRERVFLRSTTSAWSPWIFNYELHPFYLARLS